MKASNGKVRVLSAGTATDLESAVNDFLASLGTEALIEILFQVDGTSVWAMVIYVAEG